MFPRPARPAAASAARSAHVTRWAGAGAGMLVASLVVVQASSAAFTGTTTKTDNTWEAGTVSLTNDSPSVSTLFTETALKPGSTGTKCLHVTYTGSLASNVRLHAAIVTGTGNSTGLESDMTVTISRLLGDHATSGACDPSYASGTPTSVFAGNFNTFATTHTSFAAVGTAGGDTWTGATTGEAYTYRIIWELPSNAPNTAQGKRAKVNFTWEAQNT